MNVKNKSAKEVLMLCVPALALMAFAIVAQYLQPMIAQKHALEKAQLQQLIRHDNTIALCNALESQSKLRPKIIYKLLTEGVNLNGNDGIGANAGIGGRVPLYIAANYDTPTVGWLLGAGANPNGAYGYLPLCQAAGNNDIPMMQLLLDKGADPNFPTEHGRTALTCAIGGNHLEAVRLLLHRGAEVNLKDSDGQTVLDELQVAELNVKSHYDYREVERLLKSAGAKNYDKVK